MIQSPDRSPSICLRVACFATFTASTIPAMVSFSGGGGGAALGSPAGILVLLVVVAIVGLVYWLFNR